MVEGLETLAAMEYPGRVIIVGRDPSGENNVIVYAITGRSPSSQARKLVVYPPQDGSSEAEVMPPFEAVKVEVTDPAQLERGNPHLLLYDCIRQVDLSDGSFVVSNGAQTNTIVTRVVQGRPSDRPPNVSPLYELATAIDAPHLVDGLDVMMPEPDAPHYTPRISALVTEWSFAMAVVRTEREADATVMYGSSFGALPHGGGKCITTYQGRNNFSGEPLPSFNGMPFDVRLSGGTPEEVARRVYAAIEHYGGAEPGPTHDFRVGVAALFHSPYNHKTQVHVINRADL